MSRKPTPFSDDALEKMADVVHERIARGRDIVEVPTAEVPPPAPLPEEVPMLPMDEAVLTRDVLTSAVGERVPTPPPLSAMATLEAMCARCADGGWSPTLADLRDLLEKMRAG